METTSAAAVSAPRLRRHAKDPEHGMRRTRLGARNTYDRGPITIGNKEVAPTTHQSNTDSLAGHDNRAYESRREARLGAKPPFISHSRSKATDWAQAIPCAGVISAAAAESGAHKLA